MKKERRSRKQRRKEAKKGRRRKARSKIAGEYFMCFNGDVL